MVIQWRHVLAALAGHALLFTLLGGGLQCSRKLEAPPVIEAVLLDPDRKAQARQKEAEQATVRRQREQESKRKAEQDQKRKVEAERKRRDAEAAALKQKAEEAARVKAEEERKRKSEAERKQREEQKQKAEQGRREQSLRDQAAREDALRQMQEEENLRREVSRGREQAEWADVIRQTIRNNWIRPLAAPEKFECMVRVQLLPGGQVVDARIAESCGSASLDDSVVKAVLRSDPLPPPADPAAFERVLNIRFTPGQ